MSQRLISNRENLLRGRALTATNIVPSDRISRVSSTRQGGGRVELSGPYTGQQDQVIDIEIVNTTINGEPAISQPSFVGVGGQKMVDLVAQSGTAAQVITVTLSDLGTPTLAAFADLQGVRVIAANPGAGGNQITISVDQSGIVRTAANFATPDQMGEGTRGKVGDEWNFGHEVLLGNGEIPATAPRLAFGTDPQIYRAYKVFRDGQYSYEYSPTIRRGVAADTPVFSVAGSRTVTVTDGTTTETFTGIVTRFDFLSALAASTLLEVDGVVASDRLVDGAGAVDLSLQTSAYAQSIVPDGSRFVEAVLLDLGIAATAPSERLTIELKDATTTGAERWEVRGAVSQALGTAVSGQPFLSGPYGFTIPQQLPEGGEPGGRIEIERRLLPRGTEEVLPGLCFEGLRLGAKARNKEFTFTWRPRPAGECDCTTATLAGGPDAECLGLQDVEDIIVQGNLSNAALERLEDLSNWRRESVRANSDLSISDSLDIVLIERSASALAAGLIDADAAILRYPPFVPGTEYALEDIISADGRRFIVDQAGVAGAAPTAWPGDEDATVTSGEVTFRNIGLDALGVWDAAFAQLVSDLAALSSSTTLTQFIAPDNFFIGTGAPVYQLGDTFSRFQAERTGYIAEIVGIDGDIGDSNLLVVPPLGLDVGDTFVIEGVGAGVGPTGFNVTFRVIYSYWKPAQLVAEGKLILDGERFWIAQNRGTTALELSASFWIGVPPAQIIDGTVTWQRFTGIDSVTETLPTESLLQSEQVIADMVRRYQAAASDVRAAAGLNPFEDASTEFGGLCWRDTGADFFWESEDGLLPLFNGQYYHSARLVADEDGIETVESTQEFGIGLKVGCEDKLKIGDKIVIKLVNVTNSLRTYQEGDRFDAQIIAASPLQLGGGQDGDDTQTWTVRGSVDGPLNDYQLVTTAPAAYSEAGISFKILPGSLPAGAGDRFQFAIEGGQFRWRVDGGSWSSDFDIAPTVGLADGLAANFITGKAPSFVGGDTWQFSARAVNGATNATSPGTTRLRTSAATVIDLGGGAAQAIALFGHQTAAGSTVTLQGSDDDFASSDDYSIDIQRDHTWLQFADAPVTRAAWRIVTDAAISLQWIWLGVPVALSQVNGHNDDHAFTATLQPRIERDGSAYLGRGLGASVGLEWLTTADIDYLLDLLRDVAIHDSGRMAWVPDIAGSRVSVVTAELTEIEDQTGFIFQSPVAGVSEHEAQRLQLSLSPVLF